MRYNGSFPLDANRNPDMIGGLLTNTNIVPLTANNTTASIPIFKITESVIMKALWAQITTTLGNHTVAFFRLNDQTAQSDISLSTGATGTGATAKGLVLRTQKATTALTFKTASSGVVLDPTTTQTIEFTETILQEKAGAETDIEYRYTTTDTPTTGALQFYIRWLPLTPNATVTALL